MKYKVEHHNMETNMWEEIGIHRSLNRAWEVALETIGSSKIHDTVCISEDDVPVWDTDGFRQCCGLSLPLFKEGSEVKS